MLANVGSVDRLARFVLGAMLMLVPLLTGVSASSALGIVTLVAGGVLVATALFSFCPLYRVLGLRTRRET